MTKFNRAVASFAVCVSLAVAAPLQAQDAEEIMALAKAQWAAENRNLPAADAWTSIADDYTEFNPVFPTLIEGKAIVEGS